MEKLKFAVLGCGFWSKFQIGAWSEINETELVAVYNRTIFRARNIADYFNVPRVYDNPEELFETEQLDFVDIITDVDTHAHFVEMAVKPELSTLSVRSRWLLILKPQKRW